MLRTQAFGQIMNAMLNFLQPCSPCVVWKPKMKKLLKEKPLGALVILGGLCGDRTHDKRIKSLNIKNI